MALSASAPGTADGSEQPQSRGRRGSRSSSQAQGARKLNLWLKAAGAAAAAAPRGWNDVQHGLAAKDQAATCGHSQST